MEKHRIEIFVTSVILCPNNNLFIKKTWTSSNSAYVAGWLPKALGTRSLLREAATRPLLLCGMCSLHCIKPTSGIRWLHGTWCLLFLNISCRPIRLLFLKSME